MMPHPFHQGGNILSEGLLLGRGDKLEVNESLNMSQSV